MSDHDDRYRRVRAGIIAILLAGTAALAVGFAVSAAEPPDDTAHGTEAQISELPEHLQEAVRQDVEDFGWSVDYATRRRTTSPELKQALRRVHQLPDYVGQYRDDGEGDPLTIVFKDEVPEGALDEVLEQARYPVVAETTAYSMKDFQRFWREIRQILDDTAGVRHWNGGIVVPRVGATVVVERDGLIDAVDAKIAKVVPEGVADLDVHRGERAGAGGDAGRLPDGHRRKASERRAPRPAVIAGKARVTGVGDGCTNGSIASPSEVSACGSPATRRPGTPTSPASSSRARSRSAVRARTAERTRRPTSIPPSRAWRKPSEATTGGASTGNDWRSIPTDGRSTSTTTAYPSGATHSIVSRSRRPTLGSTCGCSPGATRTRSAAR